MTNNTTYTSTSIPYFYIIRHIPSGLSYAGSKRGKGSNPSTLLQSTGYRTSSSAVHRLIDRDGLTAFEIVSIVHGDALQGRTAYEYETTFLIEHDCARSVEWINQHNNTGRFEMHSTKARQYMVATTGYEYPMQNPATKAVTAANNTAKYGVRYPTMLPEFVERNRCVSFEKTGFENALANPVVREQNKHLMRQKWGVENAMQSVDITQARREKMIAERGVDNPRKDPDVQNTIRQTWLTKYGVDNPMKDPDIYKKAQATFLQRTGFIHISHDPTIKATRRALYLDRIERSIVKTVTEYLLANNLKAKDVGLSRNWKRQSDDIILLICQSFLVY